MDEKRLKTLIEEIIIDLMTPDIVLLKFGEGNISKFGREFIKASEDFGLKTSWDAYNENFILPKKLLYLYDVTPIEGIKILSSEETKYKRIRNACNKISVLLELKDLEALNEFDHSEEFYQSLGNMLEDIGITIISKSFINNSSDSCTRAVGESTQDLRGKKFITLGDLLIPGPGEIIIDSQARLTMAVSDRVRDKKIRVRRT